jgi:hypothetical protein
MKTIKNYSRLIGAFAFLLVINACSKSSSTTSTNTNPPVVVAGAKLMSLPAGWKYSSLISAGFPDGIELYYFDSIYAGRKTKMFCIAYNAKNSLFEFKPVISSTAKKLSDFNKDEAGRVLACINGGYFGTNQSFSLVKYNGLPVAAANIKTLSRTFNGVATTYYPTRAAFGINSTGDPSVAWIYHVGTGNDLIYQYPSPNANVEGQSPQPIPTETFPAGASLWNIQSAIGGSPMLLRNDAVNITDVQELISINNTTSRPRTAIGYTNNNLIILLVVEGDNPTAGYDGMNLAELAAAMRLLGCSNAINLDGGGSSSMIAGGQLLNRPGDNGIERPVVSAVLIKQR